MNAHSASSKLQRIAYRLLGTDSVTATIRMSLGVAIACLVFSTLFWWLRHAAS